MRLEGVVVSLDECFLPVDARAWSSERAAALSELVRAGYGGNDHPLAVLSRLIVEGLSAAWIWGALDEPPAVHQLCVPPQIRLRSVATPRIRIRERRIVRDEMVLFGELQVTSVSRTLFDLLRSTRWGEPAHSAAIVHLASELRTRFGGRHDVLVEQIGRGRSDWLMKRLRQRLHELGL